MNVFRDKKLKYEIKHLELSPFKGFLPIIIKRGSLVSFFSIKEYFLLKHDSTLEALLQNYLNRKLLI